MSAVTTRAGHPPARVSNALLVGVDLGGSKLRVGLADGNGDLLAETEEATWDGGARVGEQLAGLIARLRESTGHEETSISAIAIGGAGVDGGEDGLALAPNLTGLAGRDVVAEVRSALGAPVVFENDVNVAALGELHASDVGEDFCFISYGTGVGMGIVLDGRLHVGSRGAAGEIGYLPIGAWSEDPAALETGAYEHSVAGPTIGARVSAALGRPVDTPEVFDLAARGDAAALAALDEFARCAAVGIAAVVAVVDPPVIVLGGGIGRRSDLPSLIEPWLEHYGCGHVVLRTSSLGPSGPVIGAIQRARLHVIQEGLS